MGKLMTQSTTTPRFWRTDVMPGKAALERPSDDGPESGKGDQHHRRRATAAGEDRRSGLGSAIRRAVRAAGSRIFAGGERFEEDLVRFARDVENARTREAIEMALVAMARRIAPGTDIQFVRFTESCHVPPHRADCRAPRPASDSRGSRHERTFESTDLPIYRGLSIHGHLRLRCEQGSGRGPLVRRTMHRLEIACILASQAIMTVDWRFADTGLESDSWTDPGESDARERDDMGAQRPDMVRDATFLHAVLPFALSQSLRHCEPLSLICLQLDRMRAIRDLLGEVTTDRMVRQLGENVAALVRTSDIVARLEDDRIVALLVRSRGEDSLRVASSIIRNADNWRLGPPGLRGMSVAAGVAEFPATCRDAAGLLEAADLAMARARAEGSRRPVLAAPSSAGDGRYPPALGLVGPSRRA